MSKLISKIIFEGILKNISPLIIGIGKGGLIDFEVIKDEKGIFFIPGTSFKGALKHHIENKFDNLNQYQWNYFYGSQEKQSRFIVKDIKPINSIKINIRDGVAIDYKTGIAKQGYKYNYEIIEPGTEFNLKCEITINEEVNKENFKTILKTIIEELENGEVLIGAMTTKGFGKIKLNEYKIYEFNFPKDGENWFRYLNNERSKKNEIFLDKQFKLTPKPYKDFELDAWFRIKSSLIIGSYPTNPNEPDKIHIKSNGIPVLPGTSIKGAIKERAVKIINTFNKNGVEFLKRTFGWAEIEGKSKEKYKSKIIIGESIINDVDEVVQHRIKIDRFTGGTINGALFESKPLWHKNEKINIKIKIKNAEKWEIGLLLLILKDLWTEDLPIGGEKNIGRGILQGIEATIKLNDNIFELKDYNGKLKINGDCQKLENYITNFIQQIGGEA
ncbi:MAG: RAMP superfamily CRISPR-associated protein [Promethearchaeota archaeon]